MKPLNEMMDELNDGLDVKIKMSYQLEKSMKKSWGKYRAFEIALGRKMVSMMKDLEVIPGSTPEIEITPKGNLIVKEKVRIKEELECKNSKCRCKERKKFNE